MGLLTTTLLAQQATPKAFPQVTGTVVDANEQPVAEAEVFLSATGATDTKVFSANTGADGTFTLAIDAPTDNAFYTLLAWKRGHGVGTADQVQQGAGLFRQNNGGIPHSTEVTVTLPEAKSVTFQVLDPDGNPLRNTTLNTFSISRPGGQSYVYAPNNKIERLQRQTDENGVVTLDFLPPETFAGVSVETEELGRQNISVSVHQTEDDLKVKLFPSSNVKITLQGDDNTRVSGRKLFFNVQSGSNIDYQSGKPHLQVAWANPCLLYTSPSPRDLSTSRMPSSA